MQIGSERQIGQMVEFEEEFKILNFIFVIQLYLSPN